MNIKLTFSTYTLLDYLNQIKYQKNLLNKSENRQIHSIIFKIKKAIIKNDYIFIINEFEKNMNFILNIIDEIQKRTKIIVTDKFEPYKCKKIYFDLLHFMKINL